MARPDPVAVALVQAAFELHRRRLWLEVPVDAPFLMRVPGEETPLVGTLIGHIGTAYGLSFTRGESAFEQVKNGILDEDSRPEDVEAQSLLSVTLDRLADIPPVAREVLTAANFQTRAENLAPFIFSKPEYRSLRSPSRSDMRLLLTCLRAVCSVHDAGELRPTELNARKQRILQIVVEGEMRDTKVRTEVVPWPQTNTKREVGSFAELRAVDPSSPRLDVDWLLAFTRIPAEVRGDDRTLGMSIAAEVGTRRLLSTQVLPSGDWRVVAAQLAKLFADGLPRKIVIAHAELHAALAPDLAALGVRATLDPDHDDLNELRDIFADKIDELLAGPTAGFDPTASTPSTLVEWKNADRQLTELLVDDIQARGALTPRAMARYFGSEDVATEVLDELEHFSPIPVVMDWFYTDYRATKNSKTVLETRLKKKSTSALERTLIEARVNARVSMYRVDSTTPGASLDVEDIFDGTRVTIQDRAMSGCGLEGLFLPLRVARLGEWHVAMLAGPPLNHFQISSALQRLEALGVELSPSGLNRSSHLLGRLWESLLPRNHTEPTLQNTDGEPLVLQTATFRVSDPTTLARALSKRADVEHDEDAGEWTWLRPGGPVAGFGDNTVLGRLQFIDDRLVLEVNSTGRLARAREWIEALPGGATFERVTAREHSRDDQLPSPPTKMQPAMLRQLEQMHREALVRWLDESVPALGGLTPRQASRTPQGRASVERLVRTMPDARYPGGTIPAPREHLLRELGISS